MSESGHHLFSVARGGVFGFVRDAESGDIALTYSDPGVPRQFPAQPRPLETAPLWWNSRDDRLLALAGRSNFSFALPEDGSSLLARSEIAVRGRELLFDWRTEPGVVSPDGRQFLCR